MENIDVIKAALVRIHQIAKERVNLYGATMPDSECLDEIMAKSHECIEFIDTWCKKKGE